MFVKKSFSLFDIVMYVFMSLLIAFLSNIGIIRQKPSDPDIPIIQHNSYIWHFDTLYACRSVEELLNIINAKDKEALVSKFSKSAKARAKNNLDKQVEILFNYFDDVILDYEENIASCSMGAGYSVDVEVVVKTKNYDYYFYAYFTITDENRKNIGLDYIGVRRQDIYEFCLNGGCNLRAPYQTIDCLGYDGWILT